MNKCPIFSGRDTKWSEKSFIFESVAGMANFEPAMEGAFKGLAEKPLADLSRNEAQCKTPVLSSGEHGKRQGVDPRQKRREASRYCSVETHQDRVPARRSWTTHCNAHGGYTAEPGLSRHGEHVPGSTDRAGTTNSRVRRRKP